jgi:PAS domain-containing protein
MTSAQAVHLIEQFAAQSPFAIWITDSRGVAIFANTKLHELFEIAQRPSGAVGMNLFEDPSIGQLDLQDISERVRNGEVVNTILEIADPKGLQTAVSAGRTSAITLRISAFPLRSSSQKIEHFVLMMQDVTAMYAQREDLRKQIRDIELFRKSKETRLSRLDELQKEVSGLESEIRALGGTPED